MGENDGPNITTDVPIFSLEVLIEKEKKQVIYAESNEEFVDVLFSFLTTPIGTILKHRSPLKMGSMNNLYQGVKEIENQYFQTPLRKDMLLSPRNGAEPHCKKLKVNIDFNAKDTRYFTCVLHKCSHKLLSYYEDATCKCGRQMKYEKPLSSKTKPDVQSGVFVKRLTRFIITDDLQVKPVSTDTSSPLYEAYELPDGRMLEKKTWNISKPDEVLNLFVRSLVSRMPLTETFLKESAQFDNTIRYQGGSVGRLQTNKSWLRGEKKLTLKLIFSKSEGVVFYAEAGRDFVNLLFSFLTVPLGYLVENLISSGKTTSGPLNGCIHKLYESVKGLEKRHFNSNHHRESLVHPKLAFGFGYKHDLLEVGEASQPLFYYAYSPPPKFKEILTTGKSMITRSDYTSGAAKLTVIDPKSHHKYRHQESDGSFLTGPAMFVVTDDLTVKPISSIFSLSILNKRKVPFSDIEKKDVHVGKEEALRLLLYSFFSKTALTDAFMGEPKQEGLVKKKG